jgi:hypothetical protein
MPEVTASAWAAKASVYGEIILCLAMVNGR